MDSIKPFKITVPEAKLVALRRKLEDATFPDELDGAGWALGAPLDDIKRLVAYWKDQFDWRAKEQELNDELPQFTTEIDVQGFGKTEIHFVHQRSKIEDAIPLLFIHGWPGSFIEVRKLLPLLTQGDATKPAFHVVAPSLPNFGFSQGITKRGFGFVQYAEFLNSLMKVLGYEEYVTQGGDWGAILSRTLAQQYPENVRAIHLNFNPVMPPYPWRYPLLFLQTLLTLPFSANERAKLANTKKYLTEGNGYMHQQETRPQTLGYGLHDSPVGLLAWIYEKLRVWTDSYPWTDDEILTWVSIYQFSAAGPAASTRIYYEASNPPPSTESHRSISLQQLFYSSAPRTVKIALAHFPREIITLPLTWNRTIGNVVRQTEFERGGHFAAWEVPDLLAGDLQRFFGKNGESYGAVTGKNGF
ncbi:hypothetical protein VTO42DRAFT_7723 [Malbranchea cinnamomea]